MNVSVYSREAVEEIIKIGEFPENTAVISYYDTAERHFDGEYVPVDFSGVCSSDDIFYIELDDYDLEFIIRKGGTYESFFSNADALAEFIYKAYKNGKDIICQCEYGQSRSAGTAAAIMEHFYHIRWYIIKCLMLSEILKPIRSNLNVLKQRLKHHAAGVPNKRRKRSCGSASVVMRRRHT